MSQKQENLIVVLDVGSAFTRVLAADLNEGALRYRAHSVVDSAGMRKGLIADLGPAARSVKAASDRAEQQARVNIDECLVGVGGPNVIGVNTTAGLNFGARMREITKDDVSIAVERARGVSLPPDREILHLLTRQFAWHPRPGRHGRQLP
jgi:cell division protein FtsA